MAGLLDWLGDLGMGGSGAPAALPPEPPQHNMAALRATNNFQPPGGAPEPGMPPVQPVGEDVSALRPPDMSGRMAPPPAPPDMATMPPPAPPSMGAPGAPFPPAGDPMTAGGIPMPPGGDPMTAGGTPPNGPGLPMMNRPPDPPAGGPVSLAPPGAPMTPAEGNKIYDSYKAAGGGGPVNIVGQNPDGFAAPPTGPAWAPDQQGRGGVLSRALGLSPDQSNRLQAAIGAGMTAAGNSSGKSPFQALTSGAGATLEGASKEQHQNTKDAQGYLSQAIASKRAGDDAGYKTAYMKYLAAKLQADQTKAASKDAAGNKNDSPTQLYLSAQSKVLKDPLVHGALKAYESAMKTGTPVQIAEAKAKYEATAKEREAAHLAGVGLTPKTAAELAGQPGMTKANPIDAGKAGITPSNIATKLQPGQFYRNPADGQIYTFKGGASKTESKKPAGKPESANPMRSEKRTMVNADGDDE